MLDKFNLAFMVIVIVFVGVLFTAYIGVSNDIQRRITALESIKQPDYSDTFALIETIVDEHQLFMDRQKEKNKAFNISIKKALKIDQAAWDGKTTWGSGKKWGEK
jgi:predicted GIY-YIG superfamily endonuclease